MAAINSKTATKANRHGDSVQVVVLGAGPWGSNLIRTFHEIGALAAVVEPDEEARAHVADSYPDVTVFARAEEAWASPWPAVVIATPVPTHFRLAHEALAAGKHVFVEKPLTLTTYEAEELVRLATECRRILMVGHLLLYQPAIQWIKEHLDQGLIGDVVGLHQERLSLGRVRTAENALWSLGVHDVAVLLYLVGVAPTDVIATGQRVLQPTVEDDVRVELRFPGDVRAHLHSSWLWPERRRQLTIIGTAGMLVYDELVQTVTLHRKAIGPDLMALDDGAEVVFVGEGQPLRLECEHFLEAVRTGRKPLSDGESGLEVVRVLDRAQQQLIKMDPADHIVGDARGAPGV